APLADLRRGALAAGDAHLRLARRRGRHPRRALRSLGTRRPARHAGETPAQRRSAPAWLGCPDATARQIPPLRRGVLEKFIRGPQPQEQGRKYQGIGVLILESAGAAQRATRTFYFGNVY